MPNLLGTAIVSMCLGVTPQYNEACNKALDAGSRQIGLTQNVDLIEHKATAFVNTEAEETIGKNGVWIVGSSAFVFKTVKDKHLAFRSPTFGICNSVTNDVTPNSYSMKLNWNF